MSGGKSPSELRMERLSSARRWLDARGARTKAVVYASTPVPYYQVTGLLHLVTAKGLMSHAASLGWQA